MFISWMCLVVCFPCLIWGLAIPYPQNEYQYSFYRDTLLKQESAHHTIVLSEDEKIADNYLNLMKENEFQRTKTAFLPSRPIEEVLGDVTSSDLFSLLKTMPKGGLLHLHENHVLNKRVLFEIVFNSDDFPHLYRLETAHEDDDAPGRLDFFIQAPHAGWQNVKESGLTVDSLLRENTLINILDENAKKYPSDSGIRWAQMNPIWTRASDQLISNIKIQSLYLEALYDEARASGIQYMETRQDFLIDDQRLYELSTDPEYISTFGKKYLEIDGTQTVNLTLEVIKEYRNKHPEFLGHRRIVQSVRAFPKEEIVRSMENAVFLHKTYPEHIVGFDMVAEEDAGNSLMYYIDQYLSLKDGKTDMSKIPLYLHTDETNWPGDLITSVNVNDPVATLNNVYDALVLGAKRLGHGLAIHKMPSMVEYLKEHRVAVEACVVSNMILGYTPDIRNHPAQDYYRTGVPVVISSDDPGSFGYNDVTVDWYMVFMSWGLSLADVKTLILNSFTYSAMSENDKMAAVESWQILWEAFINDVKARACNASYPEGDVHVSRFIPNEGPASANTPVHVYGHNFQSAICSTLKCKFGDLESPEIVYVTSNHLICSAPLLNDIIDEDTIVTVRLTLGDQSELVIGQFTYRTYPPLSNGAPKTRATPSNLTVSKHKLAFLLDALLIIGVFTLI